MRVRFCLLLAATAMGCGSRDAPQRVIDAAISAKPPVDARKRRPAIGNLEAFTAGMARIPEGDYLSGCVGKDQRKCSGNAPLRSLFLPEFYLDETEVTVEAYDRCVGARRCDPPVPTEECPTERMNWGNPERLEHPINCLKPRHAAMFCASRQMHLPTERQLEKASRGADGRTYPWGDTPPTCERAVIAATDEAGTAPCQTNSTAPVSSRPEGASRDGVVDLIGNVAEFATPGEGPLSPATITDDEFQAFGVNPAGKYEGVRAWGGGFDNPASFMLEPWTSATGRISPSHGFRCAYQPSFEY